MSSRLQILALRYSETCRCRVPSHVWGHFRDLGIARSEETSSWLQRRPSSKEITTRKKFLSIGLVNALSLNKRADLISQLIVSEKIDILAITKSWLRESRDPTELISVSPLGYAAHHMPRSTGQRGCGVAVIFKDSMQLRLAPPTNSRCQLLNLYM